MKLFTFFMLVGVIAVQGFTAGRSLFRTNSIPPSEGYNSESYTKYPTQSSDTLKQVELFGETHEVDLEMANEFLEPIKKDLCATSMDYFFDGYVLDTYGFERLQKLSPECRKIPCDLINYVIDNIMSQGLDSFSGIENIHDLLSVIHEQLQPIYTDYFCPCGEQLFDWIVESAKFYDGNVLYTSFDEDTILAMHRFTRYVDSDSLKRFLQRTTKHLCAKRTNGVCIDDIMEAMKYIAKNIDNTIKHDGNDNLTYSEKEELMRQCDNFLHLTDELSETVEAYEFDDGAEALAKMLNLAYCKRGCKKEISNMYPCCLRDALNDKKLFKYGEDFGLSLYNLFMLHYEYAVNGYFELDAIDDMRRIITEYTEMPSEYKDLLYRVIHPAKYCRKQDKPSCS